MRLVDTFQCVFTFLASHILTTNRQLDVEGKGVAQQDIIKSLQNEATYDQVRETLKDVSVDASGRVEVEDYVDVRPRLSFFSLLTFQSSFQSSKRVKTPTQVSYKREKSPSRVHHQTFHTLLTRMRDQNLLDTLIKS